MDTLLHGKIGKILGEDLISKGHSKINIKYFIYGNILPDLSLKYRFSMHRINRNFEEVMELMIDLVNRKLNSKETSIKLGIIAHYLCDFFTFPHNENYNKTIIHHEIYEHIQRIKMWDKISKISKGVQEETEVSLGSINDIRVYIEDLHSIYMNNKSNYERDIFFSIILVKVVCISLLNLSGNYISNIINYTQIEKITNL